MKKIQEALDSICSTVGYPDIAIIESCSTDPEVIVKGKMLYMCRSSALIDKAENL